MADPARTRLHLHPVPDQILTPREERPARELLSRHEAWAAQRRAARERDRQTAVAAVVLAAFLAGVVVVLAVTR